MVLGFDRNKVGYLNMDIRHLVMLYLVIEGQADMLFSKYTRKSAFDNMLPKKDGLWSVSCRSRTECCIICDKDSTCISYFYKASQCTGFPYKMTSFVATNYVPGLVYTDLNVVDSLYLALLRGGWRNKIWLFSSDYDDRRNTLIAEMSVHSSLTADELQGRHNYGVTGSLSGMALIYICLRDNNVLTEATLLTLSDVQQRAMITNFLGGSAVLALFSDHNLANMCD